MSNTNTNTNTTPTQTMSRTGNKTPEEVNGVKEVPPAEAAAIAVTVAETQWLQNMHLKENVKNLLSKLLITKTGHRLTQFEKTTDTLPVLCADKNFWGLDEVLQTGIDLVESYFMPTYPNANQWSTSHHVQVIIVNPTDQEAPNVLRPKRFEMMEQTQVFDANR